MNNIKIRNACYTTRKIHSRVLPYKLQHRFEWQQQLAAQNLLTDLKHMYTTQYVKTRVLLNMLYLNQRGLPNYYCQQHLLMRNVFLNCHQVVSMAHNCRMCQTCVQQQQHCSLPLQYLLPALYLHHVMNRLNPSHRLVRCQLTRISSSPNAHHHAEFDHCHMHCACKSFIATLLPHLRQPVVRQMSSGKTLRDC